MYVEAEISTGEDGTERLIDTLSLIDAVMPDVVTSRKQVIRETQDTSDKAPVKAEPGSSLTSPPAPSAVESMGGGGVCDRDPMDVDSIEIPVEKSTVLKGHDSEVGGGDGGVE